MTRFADLVRVIRTQAGWPAWGPGWVARPSHSGSHGMNPVLAIGALIVFSALGALVTMPLTLLLPDQTTPAATAAHFWLSAALPLLGFLGVLMIVVGWLKRRARGGLAALGLFRGTALRDVCVGAVIGAAALAVPVGALMGAGMLSFSVAAQDALAPYAGALIVLSALFFVLQASVEELAVRGWLLPELMTRIGIWGAILLSSSLFAVFHLANPNVGAIATVNVALVGAFFALLVIAQGNLWGACGFHILWNWALSVGLGIEVSGIAVPNTVLTAHIRAGAPDLWTGGAFGIEASVITTAVLAGLTVAMWVWARRNGNWAALRAAVRGG